MSLDEPIPMHSRLELEPLARGTYHHFTIEIARDGTANPIAVPVMVARGSEAGPVVGITAAVHGNELNGIPTIHRLFRSIDPTELRGDVVAIPVVNLPGFLQQQREFSDGMDINRVMPGREGGNEAEVYASRFLTRIVRRFDYLIDLHTASFGRVNSLYVRADLSLPVPAMLARLIGAQIIVHNRGRDGTLRSAAADMGIHAITVEVGDPQRFQRSLIRASRRGILAALAHLEMIEERSSGDEDDEPTVECARSFWLYTDTGGILHVFPGITDIVRQGDVIAQIYDLFGRVVRTYHAPEDGIVVGKSTNPVAQTGARILHLGVVRATPLEEVL